MGWNLTDHTELHGAPLGTHDPTAYVFQGQHHVVYQGFTSTGGGDGLLHELYWDGQWKLNELTGAAPGAPPPRQSATSYTFNDTQHVLYEGAPSDGQVHELWWDGDWHHHALTPANTAVGDAVGYEFESDNTQNLAYRGPDDCIRELKWDNGWQAPVNFTVIYGGALTFNNPSAYEFTPIGTRQIVYTGNEGGLAGGHVHEYLWDVTGGWRDVNLHVQVPGPPPLASGQPTAYAFRTLETKHVNYVGTDGHIHELWWGFKHGWQHYDLTASIPAPAPGVGSVVTGYTVEAQETQHVVYGGIDGSVHELLWEGSWHHNNLSDAPTLAPATISRLAAYVFDDNSQHLFYVDIDHHLIELWQDFS